jgi:hypothetical protein
MIRSQTLEDDLYICLAPSSRELPPESITRQSNFQTQEMSKAYEAYIYANFCIEGLSPPKPDIPVDRESFMGAPCLSVEQVVVRWGRYKDLLGAFMEGTKDPLKMRYSLLETLSPGLERIFSGPPLVNRPLRIWWHCETPELEDLPWELITYQPSSVNPILSFVRGKPPSTPTPIVPLKPGAPLRLAYIHDPQFTSTSLGAVLNNLPPGIQVVDFPDDPRQSLERAIKNGFELVHLVADGIISLAYEGLLYFSNTKSPDLSASELSQILSGSRVSVLCLTEPAGLSPDMVWIGRYQVPSAYRAFAYLARCNRPLPNIVAPLGPHEYWQTNQFWQIFYTRLSESLSVEEAVIGGRMSMPMVMALFLRQNLKQTFHRLATPNQVPAVDPRQISQNLQQSYDLVSQLNEIKEQFGSLPDSLTSFIIEESSRQARLEADLDPWLDGKEDQA